MANDKIAALERRIGELTAELNALRRTNPSEPVPNYTFQTTAGETSLLASKPSMSASKSSPGVAL